MPANIRLIGPYVLAAFMVALALAVKVLTQPYISTSPPFILFLVAIMFTAWKWGFGPAWFTTLLSTIVIAYWVIPPVGSFYLRPPDIGTLMIFALVGLAMAYFIDRQEQERQQAIVLEGQLRRLHKLSTRLLGEEQFEALLQRVLAAAVELPKADKGTLQLYDSNNQVLEMVAQIGFDEEFVRQFQRLPLDFATCGAAYKRQQRIVVQNITTDPEFGRLVSLYSAYEVLSAQSTPLFAADGEVLGVLTTYGREPGAPSEEQFTILDLYADQAARIIEVKRKQTELQAKKHDLESQVVRSRHKLQDLASELALTESRERRALASELHDYLTQLLTLGHIKLKLAQKFLGPSPGQSERYMQETADALQRSLEYARTLIAELVPPELHESGLIAGIRWLAEHTAKQGLAVDLRSDAEFVEVPQGAAVLLYKCVRELLINVVKHADVARATVALTVDPQQGLLIAVADLGRGYDPASVKRTPVAGHFGLVSIRERLEAMGGSLTEESSMGNGTTITLRLPLAEAETERPLRAASSSLGTDRAHSTRPVSSDQQWLPFDANKK